MHYHFVEDTKGDVVDLVSFCCDECHADYCAKNGLRYGGWNGAHEGGDSVEFCMNCGVVAGGGYECEHQRDNVIVNRFLSDEGEKCECGHWIQLPTEIVEFYA